MEQPSGWELALVAPVGAEAGYLTGIQISELMHDAAMAYLVALTGVSDLEGIAALPTRPLLTGLSSRFAAPVLSRQPIVIRVRVDSRRERSFVLAVVLHRAADDEVLATGTASLAIVDAETHRPTAVPAAIWERAETLDGAVTN